MPTRQRHQIAKGPHGGMMVVLVEDVPHLGKQGDVVEVKAGYGRNYLLPRGLATPPSEHNLRLLQRYKERVHQAREARIADLKALAEQIARTTVTIEANANAEGHLYGSVGPVEVSQALRQKNLIVDSAMVRMEAPIKEVALYAVKLHLGYEIESEVKVLVVRPPEKK
jgi:large subunit ribosomal protein L9